jgi:hypothetical protein
VPGNYVVVNNQYVWQSCGYAHVPSVLIRTSSLWAFRAVHPIHNKQKTSISNTPSLSHKICQLHAVSVHVAMSAAGGHVAVATTRWQDGARSRTAIISLGAWYVLRCQWLSALYTCPFTSWPRVGTCGCYLAMRRDRAARGGANLGWRRMPRLREATSRKSPELMPDMLLHRVLSLLKIAMHRDGASPMKLCIT